MTYVFAGTPGPLINEPTTSGVAGAALSERVLPAMLQAAFPQMTAEKDTGGLPTARTRRLLGKKGTAVETSVQVCDPVVVLAPAGKFGAAQKHWSEPAEPVEIKLGPQAHEAEAPGEEKEPEGQVAQTAAEVRYEFAGHEQVVGATADCTE
jgi:hypothetical protein